MLAENLHLLLRAISSDPEGSNLYDAEAAKKEKKKKKKDKNYDLD